MPKYQVEINGASYEVELPDPDKGSVIRGVKNEITDQVGAVKELLGATKDVAGHLLSGGDRAKSTLGGLWSGLMDGVRSLPIPGGVQPAGRGAGLGQLDPTGVSQIVGSAEPTRDKLGRGLVVAAETFGPLKAINKLKALRNPVPKPPVPDIITLTQGKHQGARLIRKPQPRVNPIVEALEEVRKPAPPTTTGTLPPQPRLPHEFQADLASKARAAEGVTEEALARQAANTGGRLVPGQAKSVEQVLANMLEATRSRPGRTYTAPEAQPVPKTGVASADESRARLRAQGLPVAQRRAMARAEQEATQRPTPYSEPSYTGPERRGPNRMSPEAWEAAKDRIIREQMSRAAVDGVPPSVSQIMGMADDAKRSAAHAPHASRPPGGEGTGKKLSGLAVKTAQTKGQPTLSLKDMLAKYGAAEAAKRAGMSVDELEVRVAGASSADEVAAKLRDRIGADKAGRAVGLPAEEVRKLHGGPSRLPDKAVERIKAALAGKEPKDLTSREQALLDRIKNERGSVDPKLLAQLGLVGGGAAYGSTQTPEDPLVGALMGAGGGLLAGKALTNFPALRREVLLAGGAIPKNIATGVGGVARATIEGTGSSRTAPVKEMLRIPTNIKKFQEGRKHPTQHDMGFVEQRKPTSFEWAPSRVISGIDTAFTDILKRAGMQPSDIEGYLLTRDNDTVKRFITNAAKQAGAPEHVVQMVEKAGNFTFPFQRTPSNVGSEGFKEVGHLLAEPGKNKGRTAIALASPVIGWELAEWAKGDKQKMAIAAVLMSALGPTSALAAAGAMPNLGFQSLGGVSPIPEWGFNPEKMTGLPVKFEKGRIKYDDPSPVKFWQKALGQDK